MKSHQNFVDAKVKSFEILFGPYIHTQLYSEHKLLKLTTKTMKQWLRSMLGARNPYLIK